MTQLNETFHVLLVDNEAELLEEIGFFLRLRGLSVVPTSAAEEALAALSARPDVTVVLTDICMPFVNGLTLTRRCLRDRPEADAVEVVLMTGHATVEAAVEAVRVGAFDFLRKPIDRDQMWTALQAAHAKAISRRAAWNAQAAEEARLLAELGALRTRLACAADPLKAASEAPVELAQVLSHELRGPLVPLVGLPDILKMRRSLEPEVLDGLMHGVEHACGRLTEITDDLIELLAPRDSRKFCWGATTPARLLGRLQAQFAAPAHAADVDLALGADAPGGIVTDEAVLLRSLGRLVKNALAVTPPGGRIELSAADAEPAHVAFAVRDTGAGMTDSEIALAQQPFRQLDMSSTRPFGGLGLGLTLAGRMAERLGGRLEIHSSPGEGTMAAMTLPRDHVCGAAG